MTGPTSRQRGCPIVTKQLSENNIRSQVPELDRYLDILTDWPSVVTWVRLRPSYIAEHRILLIQRSCKRLVKEHPVNGKKGQTFPAQYYTQRNNSLTLDKLQACYTFSHNQQIKLHTFPHVSEQHTAKCCSKVIELDILKYTRGHLQNNRHVTRSTTPPPFGFRDTTFGGHLQF
jgi:hypothetical protein